MTPDAHPLVLVPLLFCPPPGVFTALLGDGHGRVDTPGAFLYRQRPLLDPEDVEAIAALGHSNPYAVAAVFEKDGYGHTSALSACAKTVWDCVVRLGTPVARRAPWAERTTLSSWRWWVLRDGFVGLPYTDRTAFLDPTCWTAQGLPAGGVGVPVVVVPGLDATAHTRLSTLARVSDDLALALGRDFPHALLHPSRWIS